MKWVPLQQRVFNSIHSANTGLDYNLTTTQQLIAVMDPELHAHLEKTGSLNLFFCFRWILISFKREFAFDQVIRLWEVRQQISRANQADMVGVVDKLLFQPICPIRRSRCPSIPSRRDPSVSHRIRRSLEIRQRPFRHHRPRYNPSPS